MKNRTKKAKKHTKNYKNLLEQIRKRKYKKIKIQKYKNNIKLTWSVIREVIDKKSSRRQKFPNKINLGSRFITSTDTIVKNFNKHFTKIDLNLANNFSISSVTFDTFLNNMRNIFQPKNVLSINELKDAFCSLKTNKSPGYDDISSYVSYSSVLVLLIDVYIISIIFLNNRVFFHKK